MYRIHCDRRTLMKFPQFWQIVKSQIAQTRTQVGRALVGPCSTAGSEASGKDKKDQKDQPMASRGAVLSLYKRLHRTAQTVFAGDQRMLVGARLKIRSEFCQNAHVTNQGAVTELIKVGEDAIKVLRHSVIQAVATDQVDPDTGKQIYRAQVKEGHLVENAPFQDNISDEEYEASVRAHKRKQRAERELKKKSGGVHLQDQPPTSCGS